MAGGVAEAYEEAVAFLVDFEGAVCGVFEFVCASFFEEIAGCSNGDRVV